MRSSQCYEHPIEHEQNKFSDSGQEHEAIMTEKQTEQPTDRSSTDGSTDKQTESWGRYTTKNAYFLGGGGEEY